MAGWVGVIISAFGPPDQCRACRFAAREADRAREGPSGERFRSGQPGSRVREERLVDERQTAPAAERNKEPILKVLRGILPKSGLMLEIACGTGQHVVHFAGALPGLTWQPSDPDPQMRASVAAWVAEAGLPNIRPPLDLDVCSEAWPSERADAVVCIDMI